MDKLQLIKKLTWEDVFAIWEKNENYPKSHWHKLYQERGFSSWQEWRQSYIKPFELEKLDWSLYKVSDPIETVPCFYGGPYKSWLELFYQGRKSLSFAELAKLKKIQQHQGVLSFIENFPKETIITGVMIKGKIYVLEGMHRCAALALARYLGKEIKTDLKIALARHHLKELPIVGMHKK